MVCARTSIICTLQADTLDFNLLVLPRTLFVVGNQRAANEIENSRAKKKKIRIALLAAMKAQSQLAMMMSCIP